MKKQLILLTLSVIFACGLSFGQARADYDKTVDFTKYKSYFFYGWQKDCDKILNEFDRKRILDSFVAEMAKRNIQYSADTTADLAMTIYLVVDRKESVTAYSSYSGGFYGRGYYYGGFGYGSGNTTYSTTEYKEGTSIVDLYDTKTRKLVWEGTLVKTINENPAKRERTIPKNISKIMYKFPVKPVKK
jgi:hypothetical protein